MPSKPISPLDAHLGYWLRFVSNSVSEEFRLSIEACGVSVSEWVALRTLFGTHGLTHGALIDALGMTKGAVSKLIARLEEKNLVRRAGDPADARLLILKLSKSGEALVPRLAELADENDRKFFGHLAPEQQAQLRRLLENIVQFHQLREVPVR